MLDMKTWKINGKNVTVEEFKKLYRDTIANYACVLKIVDHYIDNILPDLKKNASCIKIVDIISDTIAEMMYYSLKLDNPIMIWNKVTGCETIGEPTISKQMSYMYAYHVVERELAKSSNEMFLSDEEANEIEEIKLILKRLGE